MKKAQAALAVLMIVLSLSVCVSAHVPQMIEGNDGIENAVHIDDPLKSWAYYSTFQTSDSVSYFQFHLEKGDRLWLSVFTPYIGDVHPDAVIIGPGIESEGELPGGVDVLENNGYIVIKGKAPDTPTYEPFTPSANYQWFKFEYTAEVPGIYYIAMVNKGSGPGNYGVAIGYLEEFSISEWGLIPFSTANVHLWEGSGQMFVWGLPLFILLLGLLYLFRLKKEPVRIKLETVTGVTGGVLYLAGAASMLAQALFALSKTGFQPTFAVTAIFIAIPLILGIMILRYYIRPDPKPVKYQGIKLVILGMVGLVFWAGYIIGPVLVIVSGVKFLIDTRSKTKKDSI
ncbi:MAG TPA: hypothetical protein VJ857_00060 [Methanocorpusculum sp.]|nr:hypothetical protein [Methanocorpusculum sp.]HKL97044.1 hypothetical protein [Methanocorpusculum sp.]